MINSWGLSYGNFLKEHDGTFITGELAFAQGDTVILKLSEAFGLPPCIEGKAIIISVRKVKKGYSYRFKIKASIDLLHTHIGQTSHWAGFRRIT